MLIKKVEQINIEMIYTLDWIVYYVYLIYCEILIKVKYAKPWKL